MELLPEHLSYSLHLLQILAHSSQYVNHFLEQSGAMWSFFALSTKLRSFFVHFAHLFSQESSIFINRLLSNHFASVFLMFYVFILTFLDIVV